jgi:hypothetical protein
MVHDFIKSPEGIAEYEKIGQSYPSELMDDLYETDFLKDTTADPKLLAEHGEGHKPIEVLNIFRKKTREGKQYIYYGQTEYRLDKALNLKHWSPSRLGQYPIPRGRYEIVHKDFGETERVLREILHVDTGYSIPFTPENLDKIRDLGLNKDGKTGYYLEAENGIILFVATYNDLRNGDFDELAHFNKIPTPLQRKIWQDSQGIEQDQKMIDELKNTREIGKVPDKPVTAEDVRKMIKDDKDKDKDAESKPKPKPVNNKTKTTKNNKKI